jgi:hypothetical protein
MYRNLVSWAAVLFIVSNTAVAQGNPQLSDMNAEALEAYQNLDIDTAKAKLEQAIGMAGQQGYAGPEVVQLYMTLGVVHVAGASDHDQGLAAFLSALCMQGDAQLDPLLSTPDVQQVFIQAQSDAQAGSCGAQPQTGTVPPPSQVGLPPSSGGPQVADIECPPGVKCGPRDQDDGPTDFARFFFGMQFAMGFGFVQPGMPADSKPPASEIFEVVPWSLEDVNRNKIFEATEDTNRNGIEDFEDRYFFNDTSGWVPDADSFDDYENAEFDIPRATTPVSTQCEGDGIVTGPTSVTDNNEPVFTDITPSAYCVRVAASGFVPSYALRLNVGYFLTESFALSIPVRLQFPFGKGATVGLRGELAFSEQKEATGVPVSWFFGATYGRMFVKPPPKDPNREVPFITSGPVGLHTGINVRIRFLRNFGVVIGPEVSVQLPDFLLNLELPIGVEGAF